MTKHDAESPYLQQLEAHHQAKQDAIAAAFKRLGRQLNRKPATASATTSQPAAQPSE